MRFLLVAFLFLKVAPVGAADYVGNDLLSYFGATCPSQGDWTKLVLSDSKALVDILESVRDDDDCRSAAGAIAELNGLTSKIDQIESVSGRKIEIEKLKAKEIELADQLTQVTDPGAADAIQGAIREVQVEKAMLMAEDDARGTFAGENVKDVYSQVVLSTNQLYKTIAGNTKCLDKNPRLISSVTSMVSSIGGAVTLINPALGLGLSASSVVLGQTVEAVRVGKINRKIRKIADGTLVNSGFKCALESLSNRWCELTDAKELLDFKLGLTRQTNDESGFLSAVRLYDRMVPTLLDWLSKVRAGAPASTAADAGRHSEVFKRWEILQSAKSLGDGVLTQNRARYEAVKTDMDRYTIIKQVIINLTGWWCSGNAAPASSGTVTNPLYDIYSMNYSPYYLLGLSSIPKVGDNDIGFCQFDPFTQWPVGSSYIPNYEEIGKRYQAWIDRATQFTNQEFTLVLQPYALGVLSSAFEKTGNSWKVSPKTAIDDLIDFLHKNKPSNFVSSAFNKIYTDTIIRLETISHTLDDVLIHNTGIDDKKAIEIIFNAADLQYGTVVFNSSLEMVVRISLDEYFKKLGTDDGNIAAQLFAAESYLETLKKVTGKNSDELLMMDIRNGQVGAMNNMRNFIEVFAKNINDLLKYNAKQMKAADKSISSVYAKDQNMICVLLSSMPTLSRKINMKLCEGRKMEAFIKGGPETPPLNQDYLKKDFSARNCGYRDFIRKSKIYREWGIKL